MGKNGRDKRQWVETKGTFGLKLSALAKIEKVVQVTGEVGSSISLAMDERDVLLNASQDPRIEIRRSFDGIVGKISYGLFDGWIGGDFGAKFVDEYKWEPMKFHINKDSS